MSVSRGTRGVVHEERRALQDSSSAAVEGSRHWIFDRAFPLVSAPPAQQPARRENIRSVFFPGFAANRAQAARYTGPDAVPVVDAADHSRVLYRATADCAPRVLHNLVPQPEVHDIAHAWTWWEVLTNPLALVGGGAKKVQNMALRMRGVPWSYLRLRRVNIGGDIDQRDCRECIERAAAEAKRTGSHLVVMGTSRGASTVLSTVLTLDAELAGAISLVVLEAPFDTVDHVVRNTSIAPRLILALLRYVGTYAGPARHSTPLRTIDSVADVSALRAPLAFITSKADTRVPAVHTRALMDRLRERHPGLAIHHLELAKAHHSAMTIHNDTDRDAYVRFMEGLYDRYCCSGGDGRA